MVMTARRLVVFSGCFNTLCVVAVTVRTAGNTVGLRPRGIVLSTPVAQMLHTVQRMADQRCQRKRR